MSLHPVCKQPNSLRRNEIKTNDYLRNENACSVVLMLHNIRIATFELHFLYHTTSEYLRNSRKSRRNLLQRRQKLRIHFRCELNELCHLWERHHLRSRRHAHRPSWAANNLYTCRCGPWPRARPKLCTISSVRRDCTGAGPASVRVSRTQTARHPTAASVTDRARLSARAVAVSSGCD